MLTAAQNGAANLICVWQANQINRRTDGH